MARAPFQVLILPFRHAADGDWQYGVLRRSDDRHWQGIAGGGEDGEAPLEAAVREIEEETGWRAAEAGLYELDTRDTVQADCFEARKYWPADIYVVPQYFYAARIEGLDVSLSREHTEFRWLNYSDAYSTLTYDSNKTALWELRERLNAGDLRLG